MKNNAKSLVMVTVSHTETVLFVKLNRNHGFLTALQYSTFGTEIRQIIPMTMFIVQSSWQGQWESSLGSFDECRLCQVAANPQNKPTNLGCESVCSLPPSTPTVAVYYYYSAQRLTLIYHPTEGRRLSRPRWLATY